MPEYRVIKKAWLNLADPRDASGVSPRLVKEGQIVNYNGPPGSSLEPMDKAAVAAAEKQAATAVEQPKAELAAANRRIAELEAQLAAGKDKPVNESAAEPERTPEGEAEPSEPAHRRGRRGSK